MLTFKKLALVGVAGLTAFSMSCSDTDDAGGEFTTPLTARFDASDKTIVLSGVIAANSPNNITALKVTAGGYADVVDGLTGITLPAPTASLDGVYAGIQKICGTATGSKSVDVKVTATFDEGTDLEEKTSVAVICGGGPVSTPLIKKTTTLSSAGESYYDLDSYTSMKQAVAATKKGDIDLVAYCGTTIGCEGDKIYNPIDIDLFWDAGFEVYSGGNVTFYPLSPTDANTIKSATNLADLSEFMGRFEAGITSGSIADIDDFTIANNAGFIVITTNGAFRAVIVTSAGTQTVSLNITAPN